MATNEIKTKLTVEGVDDAVKGIKQIGTEGEAAAKKINGAFENLKVGSEVAKSVDELKNAFARLQSSSRTTVAGFKNIADGASKMARGIERGIKVIGLFSAAVGTAFGATAFLAKSSADTAEQIQNQADAFGISFDNMQKLRDAIQAVGGDEGMLEKALTKFTAGLNGVSDGAKKTSDNLSKLRSEWREQANAAGSTAKRLEIDAKFREKVAKETTKLKEAQSDFNGVTQDGLPGLIEYANKLAVLGDTQKQLAQVTQDFGAKGAVSLLAFLRQVRGEFDAATAAAEKIIPPLDEIGQANLLDLDTAGDKLAKNFSRLGLLVGSRIAPAFEALFDTIREIVGTVGPALASSLGDVASAIAEQITANKGEIIAFAKDITASIIAVAGDVRDAFKGINSGDTTNWIVNLKNTVVGAFTFIRDTINNVVIPAFKAFALALEPIAKALNAAFGTDFTGTSLALVAVIGKLTGAFTALGGAIEIGYGALKIFFDFAINGKAYIIALTGVVTTLFNTLKTAAIALGAFLLANPEIAVLILALGALAGTLAYFATKQTEAQKAAEAHAEAMRKLKDIQNEVKAGLPGATQALEDFKNAQLAAGAATIKNAEAQLALSQQKLDELVASSFQYGQQWSGNRILIERAANAVRRQSDYLQQVKRDLAEQMSGYVDAKSEADKLGTAQKKIADEAARAAGETNKLQEGFKRIVVRGPNGFEKSFDVPTQKLLDAQRQVDELAKSLQQPVGGNTILDEARARAQAFLQDMEGVAQRYEGIISGIAGRTTAIRAAFAASFSGLAEGFNAVGASISAAWANAMVRIIDNTRAMVNAVTGLISGLRSQLNSLAQAITRASSAAKSAPRGTERFASGGYIRGPGSGTSDSIPAWLSNGEFVIRASAVRKYGAELFAALNGMKIKPNLIGKFALGGLVTMPAMPMAALPASASGPTSAVTLVLDGQQFSGLTGPSDTLERLEKAIKTRRIRSTGRASPYATR